MSDLEQAVAEFIGSEVLPGTPADKILSSSSLFDDGIVDSLGLQQLIAHIEDSHAVIVEEDNLVPENFETVAGIAQLITQLKQS